MHDDGYFDEEIAATYDDATEDFDPAVVDPVVARLTELAEGGRALEFGIGTGRIALPLAQRRVPVCGIDVSRPMLARLAAKPGGAEIPVKVGDFATTTMDGTFSLVYLVFNTIMNLTSQAAQVACFRNAAAHLRPGGRFVIEVMVPALQWLAPGKTELVFRHDEQAWGIDEYDVATQRLVSHHLHVVDGRGRQRSLPCRYVWPAELDLMAELAGMERAGRWGGWAGEPFTRDCRHHVSVWRVPAARGGLSPG